MMGVANHVIGVQRQDGLWS